MVPKIFMLNISVMCAATQMESVVWGFQHMDD